MRNINCLFFTLILFFAFPLLTFSQIQSDLVQDKFNVTKTVSVTTTETAVYAISSPKKALLYEHFSTTPAFPLEIEATPKVPTLAPYKRPFPSMVYSAAIPGTAQAVHGKWVRAGVYAALEVFSIFRNNYHNDKARRLERQYYEYVDQNWSVVNYANWLIGYNEYYGNNASLLDVWRPGATQIPTYTNATDWGQVDLERLRALERRSIYLTTLPGGSIQRDLAFSHIVPDYGSQQYYELASKYYQFAPGWRDFNVMSTAEDIGRIQWNYETISALSPMWLDGSLQADRFNNQYRAAYNWISLLIVNHIISAFDGYFTAKVAGNKLQLQAPMARNELFTLKLDF